MFTTIAYNIIKQTRVVCNDTNFKIFEWKFRGRFLNIIDLSKESHQFLKQEKLLKNQTQRNDSYLQS